MSNLLQQLNAEMGELVATARRSLVQVRSGASGIGAGTVWHPDGLIITNAHVVRNRSPEVILPDGNVRPARILALDRDRDVAALVVEASRLPAIGLGRSSGLRPGEWVLALGHPWSVPGVATAGVVIGAGADLPDAPDSGQEWIAVSLPLRPGNSGGPLVDAAGRLVGVNTMMVGPEVGMAVPVDAVKGFLKQALKAKAA